MQKLVKSNRWNIFLLAIVLAFVVVIGYFGYWQGAAWVGVSSSTTTPPAGIDPEYTTAKTLWDWMNLLIVPLFLAIAAYYLNQAARQRDERLTRERYQEDMLIAYFEKMSDLILNDQHNLLSSDRNSDVRKLARTYTLNTLRQLSGTRKALVLQFLQEYGLITRDDTYSGRTIIDLRHADMSHIELHNAQLSLLHLDRVNFDGARLENVNLSGSRLDFASFHNATLIDVDFSDTGIRRADIEKAALTVQDATWPT